MRNKNRPERSESGREEEPDRAGNAPPERGKKRKETEERMFSMLARLTEGIDPFQSRGNKRREKEDQVAR